MVNQNVARALFILTVSAAFGVGALRYNMGGFARPGPGLFPLVVSVILFVIGLISLVQSRLASAVPMSFAIRGFAIILGSFCGFAVISSFANMTVGIVFMVFCAGLAGSSFSWMRSLKIALGLFAIALAMQKLLGLELPLF